jgi:hypothetical protein
MTQKIPSSTLARQTQIQAVAGGAVNSPAATLSGYWGLDQTLTGSINGNAGTATALATTRKIAGQDFNGTQDVSFNSDAVSEGSTNQYFTTTRARGAIATPSVASASGGGNLTYNSTSGVLTFTPPDLSGYLTTSSASSTYAPKASPEFTGTVGTQNLTVSSQGNGTSYALSLANGTYKWANTINGSNNLAWNAIYVGTDYGSKMVLKPSGDLSIEGAYYGDGSHLTGISAPVTSVNGQTGDAKVFGLYENNSGSPIYRSSNYYYKGIELTGTYVGDYFSGTGFNFTGMTVRGFTSAVYSYGGCCGGGAAGWSTTFYLDFTQAFCDAYMPGYTPRELRYVVVKQTGYTVAWQGQPQTATWTGNNPNVGHTEVITTYTPAVSTASAYITFNSENIVFINGRYSPTAWTSTLTISAYFAY